MGKKKLGKIPIHVILLCFVLLAIVPFVYMLSTAMTKDTYTIPYPPILIPKSFFMGNFNDAWNSNNFKQYFVNSLFVASVTTVITLLIATMSGYGFARLDFPGKKMLFKLYLASMMIPGVLNIVAQFMVINNLGLIDTYTGYILFLIGGGVAGNTFFLKGFFESIPRELEESVIMDGGNKFTIYTHIMLPLSKSAIGTLAILTFSGTWDEFFGALTILKTDSKRTLPIAIRMFQGQHATKWGLVFAATLIALIPIFIIFIVFQKYFVKTGATEGAIKG